MNKWISVDKKLPKDTQEVLCYRGKFWGNLMDVYTYLGNGKWQDDYGNIASTEDEGITHWRPLPKIPKMKGKRAKWIDMILYRWLTICLKSVTLWKK